MVRYSILTTVLRWLAAVLILRVLVAILANYPDYFPPNFDSLFLLGREATFGGAYRVAFYVHIVSAPLVLFNGLILLNDYVRRRHSGWHRWLGRVQVGVLLLLVLPSGMVMSQHAFGGSPAGLSFLLLSIVTAGCAIIGVVYARNRQFERHRRWMLRCYVLICSAVVLRLISGTAGLIGVRNPELAYVIAAWSCWLLPLAGFEFVNRLSAFPISATIREGVARPPSSFRGIGSEDCLRVRHVTFALRDQVWTPSPLEMLEQMNVVTGPFGYVRLLGDRKGVDDLTTALDHIVIDRSWQIRADAKATREKQLAGIGGRSALDEAVLVACDPGGERKSGP